MAKAAVTPTPVDRQQDRRPHDALGVWFNKAVKAVGLLPSEMRYMVEESDLAQNIETAVRLSATKVIVANWFTLQPVADTALTDLLARCDLSDIPPQDYADPPVPTRAGYRIVAFSRPTSYSMASDLLDWKGYRAASLREVISALSLQPDRLDQCGRLFVYGSPRLRCNGDEFVAVVKKGLTLALADVVSRDAKLRPRTDCIMAVHRESQVW